MSVKIDWLIPGEVIYQRWRGIGTLDDMRWVNQQTLDMFAQYPDRPLIHFVVNGIGQEKNEGGLTQIRQIYTALDHPQMGWLILIINKPLLRFIGNIVLQIGRRRPKLQFMDSMDGWQSALQERDSTIDWDNANFDVITRFESEIQSN